MVYANAELPQHLTAVELLEWILREREGWEADGPTRIADLLDRVLLDERRHNLIGTYSSGMIQKTQLAAAFVARPQVLLMDEPFRGLDTAATAATLDLVDSFRRDGGLLLIASHTRTLLDMLCDGFLDLTTLHSPRPTPHPIDHPETSSG
jgi:ABC-2 type transport system ATP-binding protein